MEQKLIEEYAKKMRHDFIDMIGYQKGHVGHVGGSCSCADIVAALYFHKMNISPEKIQDENRDRFIMSKGHAALAQYAALAERGFFCKQEIYSVKKLGSILQGHPDAELVPGIEANTGSLGQGLSLGFGMALGLKVQKSDAKVYVLLGDGELDEGQVWEAAAASARFHMDNITAIVDMNGLKASTVTDTVLFNELCKDRWEGFGWEAIEIDGHDMKQIMDALDWSDSRNGKPHVILAHTIKGKGVDFAENNVSYHNTKLTKEQFERAHGCTVRNAYEKSNEETGAGLLAVSDADSRYYMGIYGIADKEHKKCLFFASGIKDVELNIPDGAYTATIINARTNEEGRTTVCNRSLELPDSGDWFVYVQAKE